MNESYWKKVKADMQRQSDEALVHGECPLWEYPRYRWMFFGELLHKAKSYAEFALMAVTKGYVNSDPDRRYDETINLSCRYEPYESFIYEEACSHRGNGKMTAKAQKFRDELIALET